MRSLQFILIFVCWSYVLEASIVCRYDGIASDYKNWKNNPSAPEDPVPAYTTHRRRDACENFWYRKKYFYSASLQKSSPLVLEDDDLTYKDYRISKEVAVHEMKIKFPVDATINVCLCGKDARRDYYLTFAFRHAHYVILSVPHAMDVNAPSRDVEFHALIQPDGRIDEQLASRPLYFAHAFWGHSMFASINQNPAVQLPKEMELCSIGEYEHFRLCSAIANKVFMALSDTYGIDINIHQRHQYNIIPEIRERCTTKSIVDDEIMLKSDFEVLPCEIGERRPPKPQFYLVRSPLDDPSSSVFVLVDPKPDGDDDENAGELKLVTKVFYV